MKDHALKDALFKAEKEIQNIYTKSHDSLELAVKAKEKEIMSSWKNNLLYKKYISLIL